MKQDEEPCQEMKIGTLQLLHALKAKMEKPKNKSKRVMFVEANMGGQGVKALVDPSATDNFFEEKEAMRLGIPYRKKTRMTQSYKLGANTNLGHNSRTKGELR